MNRVKINAVSSKTPTIQAQFSIKKNGIKYLNKISTIPDTGAEMTVAGRDFMKKMGLTMKDISCPERTQLLAANNTKIRVLGKTEVNISYEGNSTEETILICDTNKDDVLMSW